MGAIYQRGILPPLSLPGDYLSLVWSYFVLVWHTLVDIALLVAMILFVSDPRTMFTRANDCDGETHRKRFVHQSFSLDDIKFIKTVMNCVSAQGFIVLMYTYLKHTLSLHIYLHAMLPR